MQHAYNNFIGFFIDVFCIYVDFYLLSFRHFSAGPMALPTDDMWQFHSYVGQYMKVDIEGICIPNYTFNFNLFRGGVLYTSVLGGVHEVAKVPTFRGAFCF